MTDFSIMTFPAIEMFSACKEEIFALSLSTNDCQKTPFPGVPPIEAPNYLKEQPPSLHPNNFAQAEIESIF